MKKPAHHLNAGEAKRRMGKPNKTDKLDAEGLAILLRNGTLPEVWIPPIMLRDQCELLRLRMFLVALRTDIKNCIHGALERYNIQIGVTDLFGIEGRQKLEQRMGDLLIESRLLDLTSGLALALIGNASEQTFHAQRPPRQRLRPSPPLGNQSQISQRKGDIPKTILRAPAASGSPTRRIFFPMSMTCEERA